MKQTKGNLDQGLLWITAKTVKAVQNICEANKLWKYLCYRVLALLLAVGTLHLFKADFYYDTDIARDMLLLEDMVKEHKLSLIGGRTSVSGVFHGPLYYWLILPFFVLSNGNPVVISWVWFVIYLLFIGAFYYVGKKVFDDKIALISTTFLTSVTITYANGFTHSVLANFLIIPLIYLVYRYILSNKVWWLLGAVLTAGLLIQFQMAFGVPVLILVGGYAIYHVIRQRNFAHLLAGLLLLIPVSTFIAFDVRHDFIQFKSVLAIITGESDSNFSLNGYWPDRWTSFIDAFRFWSIPLKELQHFAQVSTIILLAFLMCRNFKTGNKSNKFITLATLIIFGFWIVTSPFKGNVWPQYYRTLLPVVILCVTYAVIKYAPKKFHALIFVIIIGSNTFIALKSGVDYFNATPTTDEIHWKFYRQMAHDILTNSNDEQFGYYVFSPDQFGYQAKYAMRYFAQTNNANTKPYTKQPLTYLIEAPYWDDNKFLSKEYWKDSQVRIEREPDDIWVYRDARGQETYTVMRFDLTDEETTVSAEPTLIDGIHFR